LSEKFGTITLVLLGLMAGRWADEILLIEFLKLNTN